MPLLCMLSLCHVATSIVETGVRILPSHHCLLCQTADSDVYKVSYFYLFLALCIIPSHYSLMYQLYHIEAGRDVEV